MEDAPGGAWQGGGRGWMNDYDSDFLSWEGGRRGGYGGEYGSMRGPEEGGGFGGGSFGRGGYGGGMGGQRYGGMSGGQMQPGGGGYGGTYHGYEGGYGGYQDFGEKSGYGGRRMEQQQGGRFEDTGRVRASEIMTENPETLTADSTLDHAARMMRDMNVGIIPVVESKENRRLRGVITDRDIAIRAVAEGLDARSTKVADVMTTDVQVCNKNDSVRNLMEVMQREQVRRVPITDREGRLVGIVAQADLAVDLLDERPGAKREVARTLRRISEPAEPDRTGAMQASGRMPESRPRSGAEARASQKRDEA